jgi:HD-GYP domain-containing protein (c-di-GMP phosphodiesterase class II)
MYILEVWAGADPGCDNNRIADHSVEIASKMGWSGEKLVNLRVGAALRDIGKLMIPNEILKKCGRLSPEEFEILRYHTIRGEEILFKAGLHDACRIARSPWCGKIPSAL